MEQPGAPLGRPTVLRAHGHERVDDFYWLQDRGDPNVTDFLAAENRYADAVIGEHSRLQTSWEEKWRTSDPVSPSTPEFALGGFLYERYWVGGASRITRRPMGAPSRRAQLVVDTGVYGARGLGFNQGGIDISHDQRLAAVAFERVGSERFTLRVRDIDRNRDLGYAIEPVGPSVAWLDDKSLLYTRLNAQGIPAEVWCHGVGSPSGDAMVYREDDPAAFVSVSCASTTGVARIVSSGHSSSEVRLVPAGTLVPHLVVRRQAGVSYDVQYHPAHGGILYALVQVDGSGTRLLAARWPGVPAWSQWRTVFTSSADQRAVGFSVFAHHIVLAESGREPRLVVIDVDQERLRYLGIPGAGLRDAMGVRFGRDPGQPLVWIITSGPTNPGTFHQVDPVSGATEVIYRAPLPRRFNPDDYVVDEWAATAPDGVEVPLSVFYSRAGKGVPGGLRPSVLHGYGAFGVIDIPGFSLPALTLADRGWVVAHAHVRGGGELGPAWHAAGKGMQKRNSITDFIACASRLANSGLVDPDRLAARGASAGGLLVCAAVNERPELFRAVVARVPFVDCLTSLLDPYNRLTQSEWGEFGNPVDEAEVYHYIRSYSPYDNIRPCAYPAMLVTAGYQDPRVPYWEPAKYVAKLRATKTDHRPLLFRTAMQSGHSDRWSNRSEESYIMAFLVSQLE